MKSCLALAALLFFLSASAAQPPKAKIVEIAPSLSLNIAGEDATFQEIPEMGAGKFLCLWAGDAHLAFASSVHEKFDKDFKSFLTLTERGMKAEGAKSIKMSEVSTFKTSDDAEVRRYDVSFKSQGNSSRSVYYFVKSETGYFSVVITLLEPSAYDAVAARSDKLLASARTKPASKQ